MKSEMQGWPQYASPSEALRQETQNWGARLEIANRRYDNLDGELGSAVTRLAIGIVDANEPPGQFSMLQVYNEQFDDETSGALLLVNYDAETPPERTEELVATIQQQRAESGVQAAIALAGYAKRRFGPLRQDAWDIAAVHGLRTATELPVVGVSNDFDMVGASQSYWNRMTNNEYVGQQARMWSSKARPEIYGPPDCIVNRLVRYIFAGRALMTDVTGKLVTYGASTAITLDTYASTKGWVGSYIDKFRDGAMESSQLALNIMERASGAPAPNEASHRAILTHARPVADDGFIRVSARRETLELATFLSGKAYPMELISTSPDNAYRRLTADELADLAERTGANTERVREEITALEKSFRRGFDEVASRRLGAELRKARQELELPEPDAT